MKRSRNVNTVNLINLKSTVQTELLVISASINQSKVVFFSALIIGCFIIKAFMFDDLPCTSKTNSFRARMQLLYSVHKRMLSTVTHIGWNVDQLVLEIVLSAEKLFGDVLVTFKAGEQQSSCPVLSIQEQQ